MTKALSKLFHFKWNYMLTQRGVFVLPARPEEHFQHHLVVTKFIQTKEYRKYHSWFNILLEVLNSKKKNSLMFIALFLLLSIYCGDAKKNRQHRQLLISITLCMTPSISDRIVSLSQTWSKISLYPERLGGRLW